MLHKPKTREEAAGYRYAAWAGDPKGTPWDPTRCAYEVADHTGFHFYQCSRRAGHGPAGLYCKQHAKIVEELK